MCPIQTQRLCSHTFVQRISLQLRTHTHSHSHTHTHTHTHTQTHTHTLLRTHPHALTQPRTCMQECSCSSGFLQRCTSLHKLQQCKVTLCFVCRGVLLCTSGSLDFDRFLPLSAPGNSFHALMYRCALCMCSHGPDHFLPLSASGT